LNKKSGRLCEKPPNDSKTAGRFFLLPQMGHTQVSNINEMVKSHWKIQYFFLENFQKFSKEQLPQFLCSLNEFQAIFGTIIPNCSENYSGSFYM